MTINIKGKLVDLTNPLVMGIVNITPDSFYEGSRTSKLDDTIDRIEKLISEGANIIDIGAMSTKPNCENISEDEEWQRLLPVLKIIKNKYSDTIFSIDSFRANIVKRAVLDYGIDIINDISGASFDEAMFETVAECKCPYILSHIQGTNLTMHNETSYSDFLNDILYYFSEKINILKNLGVCDIIIDPGIGFSKTVEHNFSLLKNLDKLSIFERPILVGLSRKTMIWKTLNISPSESLNGTTVLHTYALMKKANILRVHDVKEAVESVKLFSELEKAK